MENHIDPKVLENGRLDRMEHHLKLTKEATEHLNSKMDRMSSAIVGDEYSGGIGIIHRLKDIEKQTTDNKDNIDILLENMTLIKWLGSAVGGFVIAIVIYIIQKQL